MSQKTSSEKERNEWNIMWSIISELLFILLPLIVITIVMLHKGNDFWKILSSVEWSFATAILFGHAVVKLVSGSTKSNNWMWERVALAVATIVVILLVPSLIILVLILSSDNPTTGLVWSQIVLFVIGCFVFIFVGGAGHSEILIHS